MNLWRFHPNLPQNSSKRAQNHPTCQYSFWEQIKSSGRHPSGSTFMGKIFETKF